MMSNITEECEGSSLQQVIDKTKCKKCRELRDSYLEKVNWDKLDHTEIKDKLHTIMCPKHCFTNIVLESCSIDDIKNKLCFHDNSSRSPLNYNECCTVYLPSLISQKAVRKKKSSEFINDLVRYVLTAKGKVKKLTPVIVKKYIRNAPIDIEFWSQYRLDRKLFSLCIENGYPYHESINACFKKSEAKTLLNYVDLIVAREEQIAKKKIDEESVRYQSLQDEYNTAKNRLARLEEEFAHQR